MKHLPVLLIALLWLPFVASSQEPLITEKKLTTEVSAVTVYFSGAQIGRKTDVPLKKGKYRLILTGLEADIVEQSLQVDASGLQISSVSVRSNFIDNRKQEGEAERLQLRIDSLKAALEDVHDLMQALAEQEKLLAANRVLGGEAQGLRVSELREAVTLYEAKYSQLKTDQRRHGRKTHVLRTLLQQTMEQKQEISGTVPPKTSEVIIEASCERDMTVNLEMRYMTPQSGWTPVYDVRAEGPGQPMVITLKANVRQSTGVGWQNVKLTLTTENPFESGQLPELKRWDFPGARKAAVQQMRRPVAPGLGTIMGTVIDRETGETIPFANVILLERGTQITGAATDFDGKFRLTNVPTGNDYSLKVSVVGYSSHETTGLTVNKDKVTFADYELEAGIKLQEVQVVEYSVPLIQRDGGSVSTFNMEKRAAERQIAQEGAAIARQKVERTSSADVRTEVEKRLTRVNYSVATPFSIPSDDKEYTVLIDQFKVDADMSYSAAPIDIPYAFLIARTTGWEDFIRLDGKASLYVSGTYIGEAMLSPSITEDTMTISLGTDRDIVIERNLMKDFRRSQTVGNRTVQQRGYEIKVKNNKTVAVRLKVEDQIPVSTTREVDVKLVESTGAELNVEKGIVSWMLELTPNENRTIVLKYEVRHPQYMTVRLE